ncbi:hypothetical protein [Allokutzneria oryzae]|uniref:Uncharacterized protein n=1 Tax=Allokutzneria oryzae TaxID=1378989 RepID=A0ABV5ZX48_9PSEU
MSTRLLWIINIVLVAAVLVLIALGYSMAATGAALVSVVFSAFIGNLDKKRKRAAFVAEHGSVEQIKSTEDLSRFREVRDRTGRVHAVREVRRTYPGMELTEAVQLVDDL